jgi:ribosome-binding protein aMBF1 (putative translation factor)
MISLVMNKQKAYTFREDLEKRLSDPEFKKAWEESEPEYLLSKQLVEKRLAKKMSQRDLAKKLKTSQAAISRIELMNGNPSFNFLKRVAVALGGKLNVEIKY